MRSQLPPSITPPAPGERPAAADARPRPDTPPPRCPPAGTACGVTEAPPGRGLSPSGGGIALGHRAPWPEIAPPPAPVPARPPGPACAAGSGVCLPTVAGEKRDRPHDLGCHVAPSHVHILPKYRPALAAPPGHGPRRRRRLPAPGGATRRAAAASPGAAEQWSCPSREVFTDGDGTGRDLDTPVGVADTPPPGTPPARCSPRRSAPRAKGPRLHSPPLRHGGAAGGGTAPGY